LCLYFFFFSKFSLPYPEFGLDGWWKLKKGNPIRFFGAVHIHHENYCMTISLKKSQEFFTFRKRKKTNRNTYLIRDAYFFGKLSKHQSIMLFKFPSAVTSQLLFLNELMRWSWLQVRESSSGSFNSNWGSVQKTFSIMTTMMMILFQMNG